MRRKCGKSPLPLIFSFASLFLLVWFLPSKIFLRVCLLSISLVLPFFLCFLPRFGGRSASLPSPICFPPTALKSILSLGSTLLAVFFMPFLSLINFFPPWFSRQIRWRGIRYELISPQETRVLTPM